MTQAINCVQIVNSLCHRDYRVPKGNEVAIFKDRVEIYNPGDFPEGYRPEDFIKGKERSILRNPRIAEALFRSKDIERWGSGLKRISDECAENGVRVEFKVLKSGFLVAFHRSPAGTLTHSTVGKTVGKTTDKIIALIKENPRITREELARLTGLSVRGIEWNLQRLRTQGRVKRVGSRKLGRWEVVR
ncbi:MAG: winged helix-turn-helix transcriptional regulator [Elusimicrobia bacterium]|nr:winged helix-turn-helix transcriptional regulator [Elusimicrobiota bacterium]